MDNIHVVKETTRTAEKKPLVLVLPYLGPISLQTKTTLKKSLKNILNCCKMQIVFKNKTRLGNNFHFKDQIPKDLTSDVVYKFQCGLCNESYGDFSILTRENKKLLLELKESLLIMKEKPSLNRNITLAPLYIFDRV